MKRTLAILVPALFLAAAPEARADSDAADCFPLCAAPVEAPAEKLANLCEHSVVREAARIDRKLAPVKEVVEIATNPTGFALKQVNDHVVRIPKWVGIAMDPKGYVKNRAVAYVRNEAKKAVGVEKDCAEEIKAEDSAES